MDFANELDALITKAKGADVALDDMVADLRGAADGLEEEINNADED